MKELLVNIIVPIYNVEKYLEECLDAIVGQTYKNIQVILVNDGSTDNSGNIAKEYVKKYDNFILIEQENLSIGAARNTGLRFLYDELVKKNREYKENDLFVNVFKGEKIKVPYIDFKYGGEDIKIYSLLKDPLAIPKPDYILFADSDDYLNLDCIKVCVENAMKFDVDIVSFGYDYLYELEGYDKSNIQPHEICNMTRQYAYNNIISGFEILLKSHPPFTFIWSGIIKSSILRKIRSLPFVEAQDMSFGIELFAMCDKIKMLNFSGTTYRIRKGSIMDYTNQNKTKYQYLSFINNKILDPLQAKTYARSLSYAIVSLYLLELYKHTYKTKQSILFRHIIPCITIIQKALELNIDEDLKSKLKKLINRILINLSEIDKFGLNLYIIKEYLRKNFYIIFKTLKFIKNIPKYFKK